MKVFILLLMMFMFVSCNSGKGGEGDEVVDCQTLSQEERLNQSGCDLIDDSNPIVDDGGTTTGGTTTGGTTTGGTTTGGTTTGGTTTGGTTTGGTTTGGTTTGGTTGGTSSVPPEALIWDANIYFVNFSAAQENKVMKAVDLMKKVIASKAFRDAVINHTYNGKKTFVDNNGLTNAQIYQRILDGAERVGNTKKNNTMDVELELYYAATSTIGYTYPNVTRIWMNTKYFNTYTPVSVSANLMHEWLHKLGFGHAQTWSTSRDYSVPYAIGRMMSRLAQTH